MREMSIEYEGSLGYGYLEITDKLDECRFFLQLMERTTDWHQFRWLTSAFLNAARAGASGHSGTTLTHLLEDLMGWVSYLEDKLDRLNSDLDQIKKHRDPRGKGKLATSKDENRLHALIRVCERFVRDINRYLEIATDPELNLADELLQLRSENRALREKVKVLDDTQNSLTRMGQRCSQLQKDFDRANGRAGKIMLSWKS